MKKLATKTKKNRDAEKARNRDGRTISAVRVEMLNRKLDITRLRISSDGGYVTIIGRVDFSDNSKPNVRDIEAILSDLNKTIRRLNGVKHVKYALDNWELRDGKHWFPKNGGDLSRRDWLHDLVEEVENELRQEKFGASQTSSSKTELSSQNSGDDNKALHPDEQMVRDAGQYPGTDHDDHKALKPDEQMTSDAGQYNGDDISTKKTVYDDRSPEERSALTISQMLSSENRDIKVQAAMVLNDITDTSAKSRIEKALKDETDKHVIATLVKTLAKHTGSDAIPVLIKFLGDSDDRVRANTVEAFEIIGGEEIVSHLLPLLDDSNHRVKGNVIKALTSVGREKFIGQLQSLLDSESWQQRAAAVYAMRSLKPSVAVPMLRKPLNDKDIRVARKAADTLTCLGARDYIIRELDNNPRPELLPHLIRGLADTEFKPAEIKILSGYISHPDSDVVLVTLNILANCPGGNEIIKDCLKHPDSIVKAGAIRLLAQSEDPELIRDFIQRLSSVESAEVNMAIQFLARLDAEKIVPAMMELVVPRDDVLTRNAIRVLEVLPASDGKMALQEIAATLKKHLAAVQQSLDDIADKEQTLNF